MACSNGCARVLVWTCQNRSFLLQKVHMPALNILRVKWFNVIQHDIKSYRRVDNDITRCCPKGTFPSKHFMFNFHKWFPSSHGFHPCLHIMANPILLSSYTGIVITHVITFCKDRFYEPINFVFHASCPANRFELWLSSKPATSLLFKHHGNSKGAQSAPPKKKSGFQLRDHEAHQWSPLPAFFIMGI